MGDDSLFMSSEELRIETKVTFFFFGSYSFCSLVATLLSSFDVSFLKTGTEYCNSSFDVWRSKGTGRLGSAVLYIVGAGGEGFDEVLL